MNPFIGPEGLQILPTLGYVDPRSNVPRRELGVRPENCVNSPGAGWSLPRGFTMSQVPCCQGFCP